MAANKKKATARHTEDTPVKSFLDMIAPSVVQFNPDHFICGNTFRCVWALREYPTQTDEQALLRHLGEKDGITLRIYTRQLTPAEEKRIIQNAANKNRMGRSNTNDLQQTITAESNLQDMISMEGSRHRNKEPLFHCAVYIELTAPDYDALKLLQTDVLTELVRSKLNVDRLLLRQQQMVETKVTIRIARIFVVAVRAIIPRPFLQMDAEAIAEPSTKTSAICMEKASSPQIPASLPQAESI